ncbi:60S ribosomal protein L32-like [Mirounga leonina]|uniref:60S ribosomal protein L32-like n=1 Tax=Mirounga leonina TaxID=9715 RepID=UPI00156C2089|nr:60S ribosomal protein L32-like [Mirounga leonina]
MDVEPTHGHQQYNSCPNAPYPAEDMIASTPALFSGALLNREITNKEDKKVESAIKYDKVSLPRCSIQRWQPSPAGHHGHLSPLTKPKIIKKRTKKFIQHQSDPYVKIKQNWQKPKGTDNRVHRRFKGQILMPNTGYRSNKETEHMPPSGFQKFLIHSIKELEVLLVCNKSYCAEFAHNVSPKNHRTTVERAAQLAIRVSKPSARLCSKKNE